MNCDWCGITQDICDMFFVYKKLDNQIIYPEMIGLCKECNKFYWEKRNENQGSKNRAKGESKISN